MKAIVCSEFGEKPKLALTSIPIPRLHDTSQVLIRVSKASVSYMDWLMTRGRYQLKPQLPYVPGTDAVGIVEAVGSGVHQFKKGDRVACSTWYGAYAEFMAVDQGACVLVPSNVSDASAASVIYAYGTAYYALIERAQLTHGEFLLVTGAAGGVGIAAVEIGAHLGARVIAGVSSDAKAETVRAYGASNVIVYSREDIRAAITTITGGHGVDVCFETVGGEMFESIARSMAWNGRLLPIGFASGTIPMIRANLPLIKNYSIVGAAAGPWWERDRARAGEVNKQIFRWLSEEKIKPRVDREVPLEQAIDAMESLGSRSVQGRIVLNIASGT